MIHREQRSSCNVYVQSILSAAAGKKFSYLALFLGPLPKAWPRGAGYSVDKSGKAYGKDFETALLKVAGRSLGPYPLSDRCKRDDQQRCKHTCNGSQRKQQRKIIGEQIQYSSSNDRAEDQRKIDRIVHQAEIFATRIL